MPASKMNQSFSGFRCGISYCRSSDVRSVETTDFTEARWPRSLSRSLSASTRTRGPVSVAYPTPNAYVHRAGADRVRCGSVSRSHRGVAIGGDERSAEVAAVRQVAPQSRDQRCVVRFAGVERNVCIDQSALQEVADDFDLAEGEARAADEIRRDGRAVRLRVHEHAIRFERRIEVAERLRRREQIALQILVLGVIERRVLQPARVLHERCDRGFRSERLIDGHLHVAHDHRLAGRDLKARLPACTRRELERVLDARAVETERFERRRDLRVRLPHLPAHQPLRRVATEIGEAEERFDVRRLRVGYADEFDLGRCRARRTMQPPAEPESQSNGPRRSNHAFSRRDAHRANRSRPARRARVRRTARLAPSPCGDAATVANQHVVDGEPVRKRLHIGDLAGLVHCRLHLLRPVRAAIVLPCCEMGRSRL